MRAAILCGGKGTRLRGIIGEHQKCAVEVGGRLWIGYVIDVLVRSQVVDQIDFLAGYKFEEIKQAVDRVVGVADDDEPLYVSICNTGTADAIRGAHDGSPLLVVNGDTLVVGFDFRRFLEKAESLPGNWAVRGPSALDRGLIADSGIYLVRDPDPDAGPAHYYETSLPFLDIGTPDGLALARVMFEHRVP